MLGVFLCWDVRQRPPGNWQFFLLLSSLPAECWMKINVSELFLQDGFIIEVRTGKCLQGDFNYELSVRNCDPNNKNQRWRFGKYNPVYHQMISLQSVSEIDSSLLHKFSVYLQAAHKKRLKQQRLQRSQMTTRKSAQADNKTPILKSK